VQDVTNFAINGAARNGLGALDHGGNIGIWLGDGPEDGFI
jgi:hypothetical protein